MNQKSKPEWEGRIAISTFHEYINEAIFAIGAGMKIHDLNKSEDEPVSYFANRDAFCEINYRYAFLMIANSLEAAANAMLLSVGRAEQDYQNKEKSKVVDKVAFFCAAKNVPFDLGSHRINRINEISDCRNEFVHPKPRLAQFKEDRKSGEMVYNIKKSPTRNYPFYFSEIHLKDALNALKVVLDFISWIVFDLCGYSNVDGALLIGYYAYGSTGVLSSIEAEFGMSFDYRCFGH